MKIGNPLWKVVNLILKSSKYQNKSIRNENKFQKWYILPLNSSLEMLVFNLWSPKMLRSVLQAGSKE